MSAPPRLAPLYRRILGTYRAKAGPLFALAAILFVPLSLLDLAAAAVPIEIDSLSDVAAWALLLVALVESAAILLGTIFFSGAVSSIVLEPRVTRTRVIEVARTLPYGRLVGVDLLFYLVVFAGLLMLIVPGIVLFTYFALAAAAVELEGRGVREGMRRSRSLVRGSFWKVLLIVGPIALLPVVVAASISRILATVVESTLLTDWFGSAVAQVAFTPLFAVAVVILLVELAAARGEPIPAASAASAPPQRGG